MATYDPKQDRNQFPQVFGVSGTLGDTYGTAEIRPATFTDDGKLRVESSAEVTVGTIERVNSIGTLEIGTVVISGTVPVTGASSGTTVTVDHGTVTLSNPTGTTVQFNNGTVDLVKAGTLTTIGSISNIGMLHAGTVVTSIVMTDTPGGTLDLVTRLGNVGTIESGTITLANPTGTTVTVDHGTVTLSNPTGTTVQFNNGTVDLIKAGTVQVNPKPTRNILTYGTTSAGTIGTIVAAPGAGTSIYIESLDISVQSGTVEPCVSFGLVAGGQGVLARGMYAATGGIQKTFSRGVNGGTTNAALTWNVLTSSGTVSYNVAYWVE